MSLEEPQNNNFTRIDPSDICDGMESCDTYSSCIFEKGENGFLKKELLEVSMHPFGYAAAISSVTSSIQKFNLKSFSFSIVKQIMLKKDVDDDGDVIFETISESEEGFDKDAVIKFLLKFLEIRGHTPQGFTIMKEEIENDYLDFTENKVVVSSADESCDEIFTVYEFKSELELQE